MYAKLTHHERMLPRCLSTQGFVERDCRKVTANLHVLSLLHVGPPERLQETFWVSFRVDVQPLQQRSAIYTLMRCAKKDNAVSGL